MFAGASARTAGDTFRRRWWRRSRNSSAPTPRRARTRGFARELDFLLRNFAGRPTPLQFAPRLTRASGRPADLPQARRSAAHRRAQNQQLPRPGLARRAHGQAPRHRGDRRRAARRGHGHGGGAIRPGMRRVHGHRGHGAAAAQRFRMRLLGAEVVGVEFRQPHAEGRDQRSHARLGDQRAHHALSAGLGARRASLSADGARFSQGDRRRGARANSGSRRAACRICWSPAWAAARTRSGCFTRFWEMPA